MHGINLYESEILYRFYRWFLMLEKNFTTLCSDVQGGFHFKNRILRTFERGSAENENFVRNSYINIYII